MDARPAVGPAASGVELARGCKVNTVSSRSDGGRIYFVDLRDPVRNRVCIPRMDVHPLEIQEMHLHPWNSRPIPDSIVDEPLGSG